MNCRGNSNVRGDRNGNMFTRFSYMFMISLLFFSEGSSLKNFGIPSGKDDLLRKFFAETFLFLNGSDTRHVTVVGESDEQLRQTEPILEAFPHFVGKDAEEFCQSEEFAPDTIVVYFLASLEKKYINKVRTSLSKCRKKHSYFVFEKEAVGEVGFEWILRGTFEELTDLPVFVHHTKKSLKFYGYKITANCSGAVDLLIDWKPGFDTKKLENWRNNFSLEGCPLRVGTMHRPPWMSLAKDENGTTKITGGSEGEMLLTIAEKMRFAPLVQNFQPRKLRTETEEPIVANCASGNTSVGVAQMNPKKGFVQAVDMSPSYAEECIVWAIPKIHHWSRDIVTSEFSWSVWLLIGLIFLASFGLEVIVRKTTYSRSTVNTNDAKCLSIILDLIGWTLGSPTIYEPVSKGGKFLLMIYLCYSTVITTAYKTSLSSMLTVDNGDQRIVEAEDIIKWNITPGGSMFKLSLLQDQIGEDESMPEMIKRYVIETNISKAIRRVSQDLNFAYLTSFSDIVYHTHLEAKNGERVSFDMPDRCVVAFRILMVFPKSWHLTSRINRVIQSTFSSGLVKHWMDMNFMWNRMDPSFQYHEATNVQEWLHTFTRLKFFYIFHIYSLALILCIIVFFVEILTHKLIPVTNRNY